MKRTLAFVDEVDGATARLIAADGAHSFALPSALLPPNTVEGSWVQIEIAPAEAPDDGGKELRKRLVRDDDGGDLKL